MRNLFAGSIVALGLSLGVAFAQTTQRDTPATQPGAAGQKQGTQGGVTGGQPNTTNQVNPGQGQLNQGQTGQIQPGQIQPGQVQPGAGQAQRIGTQGQAGQPGTQAGQLTTQQGQQGQLRQGQAGQQDQQSRLTQGNQGQGNQGQGALSDQQIALCLYGGAANEIEIARLAEQKAQSDEVRQFAQRMVKDHTPSRDEMKQLAGNLASDDSRQRGQSGNRAGASESAGQGAAGGLDWVSVKKELAEQCLESTKKELSAKQSHEFDQCFMVQQAVAHQKMVDELTVFRNHASGQLRQKLDQEMQTAQHHLQMAKDLAKKVSDQSSERLTRRPDGNK